MLDMDLAQIYGVSTKRLNQQFLRNRERFPEDFAFQLSENDMQSLRLQNATSKKGRGGRRYRPYAFTEFGAVMLSSVLASPMAIQASILIARAFVRLRQTLSSNKLLARKLQDLERKVEGQDQDIHKIFDAIRELMEKEEPERPKIGFQPRQ